MILRYPGGKTKLSDSIIEELLRQLKGNVTYCEPFLGGGGILLKFLKRQHQIKKLILNDRDTGIAALWTSIIHYPNELIRRILDVKPSTELFYDIKEELNSHTDNTFLCEHVINYGVKKLIVHQLSYSGLGVKSGGPLGGKEQKSKYKIDCRWNPDHLSRKIVWVNKLLSRFEIAEDCCTNKDFAAIIGEPSLYYMDPPYYQQGNNLYQYGFSDDDHSRLCDSLKNLQDWVLSYDDCNEIRSLYDDWADMYKIYANYTIVSKKDKQPKSELLILPNAN